MSLSLCVQWVRLWWEMIFRFVDGGGIDNYLFSLFLLLIFFVVDDGSIARIPCLFRVFVSLYIYTIYTVHIHCRKMSNLFVRALETGTKANHWWAFLACFAASANWFYANRQCAILCLSCNIKKSSKINIRNALLCSWLDNTKVYFSLLIVLKVTRLRDTKAYVMSTLKLKCNEFLLFIMLRLYRECMTWFIRHIYYRNLQFLNNVSISKTKVLFPQA